MVTDLPQRTYPDGTTLRRYQAKILAQITRSRGHIELPYGAGKTLIAIQAALDRFHKGYGFTVAFVFCRPRNMITWRREIHLRFPDVEVYEGLQGLATMQVQHDMTRPAALRAIALIPIHRVAPEQIRIAMAMRMMRPSTLICDESTVIKNPKAQVTTALQELAHTDWGRGQLKLTLTGNSVPESLTNIWGQFAFLYGDENPLGKSYYAFLRKWFVKSDYMQTLDQDKAAAFWTIVLRYSNTLDPETLPEYDAHIAQNKVNYLIETYEESPEQRRLLDYLYAHWALPNDPDPVKSAAIEEQFKPSLEALTSDYEYTSSLALMQKGQQIASGFYYSPDLKPKYLFSVPKLALLVAVIKDLLTENLKRQIIVWSAYLAEREYIAAALWDAQIPNTLGPGETALREFLENKFNVIIMPATVSQGFNELCHADTAIFFSNVYSQEMRSQAEARNTGARQVHKLVNIIDLVGPRLLDSDAVTLLQAKMFTPARAKTIVKTRIGNAPAVVVRPKESGPAFLGEE